MNIYAHKLCKLRKWAATDISIVRDTTTLVHGTKITVISVNLFRHSEIAFLRNAIRYIPRFCAPRFLRANILMQYRDLARNEVGFA